MTKNNCEICKTPISADTHHIQSTSKKGKNKKFNKCVLCPNCHRLVHTGEIILEGRFFTTDCKINETELIWRYKNNDSITCSNDPDVWIFKNTKPQ